MYSILSILLKQSFTDVVGIINKEASKILQNLKTKREQSVYRQTAEISNVN